MSLISEHEALEMYDECLNCDGPVSCGGLNFEPADVLKEMDPTAYRCGFNDYVDHLTYDGIYVEGFTDDQIEDEDDGQPDEAQEWHDFDPDC